MLVKLAALAAALSLQVTPAPAEAPRAPKAAPPVGEAAEGSAPAKPDPETYDEAVPPPGSPAELALWKAGVEASTRIRQSRAAAQGLLAKVKGAELPERLDAAAKRSGHEGAERLRAVTKRLRKAWADDSELLRRRWPVDPTRGCGYPHLYFDAAMRLPPGANRRGELESARSDLQTCVDRARVATQAMMAANIELDAAIREANGALAEAEAAPGGRGETHEAHEQRERGERK